MFRFILALLMIAGGVGAFVYAGRLKRTAVKAAEERRTAARDRDRYSSYETASNLSARNSVVATMARVTGIALVALGALTLLSTLVYRLDVGEAAVLKPISGDVKTSEAAAGFHAKAPWVDAVKFEVRNQNIEFVGTHHEGPDFSEDNKISDNQITGSTADNATAYLDLNIQYSNDPGKVLEIYRAFRTDDNFKQVKVLPGTRSAVQIPITTYATSDIRQSRSALQAAMKQQLEDQLEQYGMRVDSVDIRNISFTDEVQKNLDNVQAQKAQTNQAIEKLNTARLAAEAVRVDAQAQSDRDQITRCGATTITVPKTVNGKTVEETQVVPVPNDKCQNRLNENVLASKYIDMLEKAAEKGNTIYVVPQGASNIISLAGPSSAGRN